MSSVEHSSRPPSLVAATPRPASEAVALQQTFDPVCLSAMRTSVAAHAADLGVRGDRLKGFVLAITELATNAIRHGGGAGDLTLWQQATKLCCRVTNRRPARTLAIPRQRPPLDTVGGRRRPGCWCAVCAGSGSWWPRSRSGSSRMWPPTGGGPSPAAPPD
ncbi:ATP-binding protein [Allorhizocola rhizosphaerae]|uniref:ATP-binding protein n=1 Tax=Allorhizocola rhizosphaerae TaxID=1872709 RepID=UPI003CCC70D8